MMFHGFLSLACRGHYFQLSLEIWQRYCFMMLWRWAGTDCITIDLSDTSKEQASPSIIRLLDIEGITWTKTLCIDWYKEHHLYFHKWLSFGKFKIKIDKIYSAKWTKSASPLIDWCQSPCFFFPKVSISQVISIIDNSTKTLLPNDRKRDRNEYDTCNVTVGVCMDVWGKIWQWKNVLSWLLHSTSRRFNVSIADTLGQVLGYKLSVRLDDILQQAREKITLFLSPPLTTASAVKASQSLKKKPCKVLTSP